MDSFHANPFSMLDDDAPQVSAKKAEPKVEPPKKTNTGHKNAPRGGREGGDRGDRREGGRGGARGGGEGRGRGNGEGRGRGRGRGRGGGREGKREFDRHESGTGRDRGAKKGGAGKYNWGTEGDEGTSAEAGERPPRRNNNRFERPDDDRAPRRNNRPAAEEVTPSTEAPAATEEAVSPEAEVEQKTEAPVEEVPPEPEVISYEEYLVQAEAKRVEADRAHQVRQVGDDQGKWKSAAKLEAKVEDEGESYGITDGKKKEKKGPSSEGPSKKKAVISLDEFKKSSSTSRGRGRGRGGPRGGGRGGGRGGNRNFNLAQSEDQFPSLGK